MKFRREKSSNNSNNGMPLLVHGKNQIRRSHDYLSHDQKLDFRHQILMVHSTENKKSHFSNDIIFLREISEFEQNQTISYNENIFALQECSSPYLAFLT